MLILGYVGYILFPCLPRHLYLISVPRIEGGKKKKKTFLPYLFQVNLSLYIVLPGFRFLFYFDNILKQQPFFKYLLLYFQFKQISQAYEVLSNPEKRKIYDQGGEQAIKEGGIGSHNGMSSPMDIFDMFFGGGTRKRDNRSANVVHQLSVTLEEIYNGAVRKLAVQKNVICDVCEGKTCSKLYIKITYIYINKFGHLKNTRKFKFFKLIF